MNEGREPEQDRSWPPRRPDEAASGRRGPAPGDRWRNPHTAVVYRRVAAFFIDFVLVGFVTAMVGMATGTIAVDATGEDLSSLELGLARWEAAAFFIYRWAMQSAFGFTVGKAILRLRIVAPDGGPASPMQVLYREVLLFLVTNLAPFLPFLAVFFAPLIAQLADLWVALRRTDGRALHDLPAGTRVVRVQRAGVAGHGGPPAGPA